MINVRKYIDGTLYNNKPMKPPQYSSYLSLQVAIDVQENSEIGEMITDADHRVVSGGG